MRIPAVFCRFTGRMTRCHRRFAAGWQFRLQYGGGGGDGGAAAPGSDELRNFNRRDDAFAGELSPRAVQVPGRRPSSARSVVGNRGLAAVACTGSTGSPVAALTGASVARSARHAAKSPAATRYARVTSKAIV